MAYACKTSSARSIVGVIPYLPYSKQCKMRKRGCIVTKLLAKVMNIFSYAKNSFAFDGSLETISFAIATCLTNAILKL